MAIGYFEGMTPAEKNEHLLSIWELTDEEQARRAFVDDLEEKIEEMGEIIEDYDRWMKEDDKIITRLEAELKLYKAQYKIAKGKVQALQEELAGLRSNPAEIIPFKPRLITATYRETPDAQTQNPD